MASGIKLYLFGTIFCGVLEMLVFLETGIRVLVVSKGEIGLVGKMPWHFS
jgi:hypothetical protein